MFINHGLIPESLFLTGFNQQKEVAAKIFHEFYHEKITKALKSYFDRPRLNQLEKQLDLLVIELMSEWKNDSFSIGPIIYYYLQKISEAKNIRLIYSSTYLDPNDLLDY
jgi:vacuolar-type H+-ATPase subunit C/Vma6